MKANYHTHTKLCGHATGEVEVYIQEAIKNGYKILGFSDHCPFPGHDQPGIRMDYEKLDEYISTMKEMKEKYKDQIQILIGLEVEYMKQFEDYYRWLKNEKGLDYLILGQHCFLDENGNWTWYGRSNFMIRLEDMLAGMRSGLFLYCAHPDIVFNEEIVQDPNIKDLMYRIIDTSIEYDCPIEINAQGMHLQLKIELDRYYPYEEFWMEVGKTKAKSIIGVDAHTESDFGDPIVQQCYDLAKKCKVTLSESLEIKK